MNRKTKWALLALCLVLLAPQALAEARLSARIEGNALYVFWSALAGGEGSLTVSQNGWPVGCYDVRGNSGEATVPLSDPSGAYAVRLVTKDGGCLMAKAEGGDPAAQTQMPENTPTAAPLPTSAPANAPGTVQSDLAAQVVEEVNRERAKAGLPALRVEAELTRAARVRASEIARSFSHTRPDGSAWSTVSGAAYGENIAMGQRTADKVMAAWMSSEGHLANILRPSFGSIGVCAYVSGGVTYWVQLFGK